jgi:cob(I)alamin adenosyltransferase
MVSREDDKHRLGRVVTRSGDRGETGLADGSRLPKNSPRIEAIGTVDELNAALGVLCTHDLDESTGATLTWLQQRLFDLGAELAVPGQLFLPADALTELESHCDVLNAELPPLKEFVLPGGSAAGAWCHYCRTLARRAERCLVAVPDQPAESTALALLNRLSDYLFMLARTLNRAASDDEPQWQHGDS